MRKAPKAAIEKREPPQSVRMSPELLARVDASAAAAGEKRGTAIIRLLVAALDAEEGATARVDVAPGTLIPRRSLAELAETMPTVPHHEKVLQRARQKDAAPPTVEEIVKAQRPPAPRTAEPQTRPPYEPRKDTWPSWARNKSPKDKK